MKTMRYAPFKLYPRHWVTGFPCFMSCLLLLLQHREKKGKIYLYSININFFAKSHANIVTKPQ